VGCGAERAHLPRNPISDGHRHTILAPTKEGRGLVRQQVHPRHQQGFFAGIAGGLWCFYTRYVGVEQFTFFDSIWYVGMLIVGGLGSVPGAIFGTMAFIGLQQIVILYGSKYAHINHENQ